MISNTSLIGAREIIGRLRASEMPPPCPSSAGPPAVTDPSASAIGIPLPDKAPEPGVDCRR
ncbi:MAG TPA: hypothetical protein VFO16_14295 [Pseudonocardiaceae bacterium]|nr:hypothetical protein [Pseudonocardiaceae bacterium]